MKTWAAVLLIHAVLIGLLFFTETAKPPKLPTKKVTVRTISLKKTDRIAKSVQQILDEPIPLVKPKEMEEMPQSAPPTPESVAPEPIAENPPQPKKPPVKKTTVLSKPTAQTKKELPSKKTSAQTSQVKSTPPTVKKTPSKKGASSSKHQDEILALAKKSLADLENLQTSSGGRGTKTPSTSTGKKIETLGSESFGSFASTAADYEEELASYLKHLLQLPEVGEVKIKLTLSSLGKVVSVSIVSSSSDKNKSYVEKKLPSISFPAFRGVLAQEKQHTFPVTLKSTFSR